MEKIPTVGDGAEKIEKSLYQVALEAALEKIPRATELANIMREANDSGDIVKANRAYLEYKALIHQLNTSVEEEVKDDFADHPDMSSLSRL